MALKILLADDNITAQKMGAKILTDAGYAVVAVSNGAAAMKKIVADKPELLILDVYMPGYSGLEVCDKVKNAPETAQIAVLLTVTNMEPFSAEDGNRVKADGVLVKPFEATDVLAVVHKLEEKLHAPAAAREQAVSMKTAAVKQVEDESYSEWKAEEEVKAPEMSHEVGSAPLMGIEQLEAGEAPAFAVHATPASFTTEHVGLQAFDLNPSAPAPDLDDANTQVAEAGPVKAPPQELEFTSAPAAEGIEVPPAPELEITAQEAAEVAIIQDAALVTDPTEIVQFATKFGQEHPEDVPVGIAMEQPPEEIEAEAEIPLIEVAPAEPQSPHWGDPEVRQALGFSGGMAAAVAPAREAEAAREVGTSTQALEIISEPAAERAAKLMEASEFTAETAAAPEIGIKTQPMDAMAEPETAPAAQVELMPETPEAHAESGDVTNALVAQFVAELERAQAEAPEETWPQADMEPPATAATAVAANVDEQQVSEAVNRVLERYKGELIAAIVRELKG